VCPTHAQLCSENPVTLKVSTSTEAAHLATKALCPNAKVRALWQGNLQLSQTIVVGNGTSLTVLGDAIENSVANGGGKVQLFDVWGNLTIVNMTLLNGHTPVADNYGSSNGGAIIARPSAELNVVGSLFSDNGADFGGAIAVGAGSVTHMTGCTFNKTAQVWLVVLFTPNQTLLFTLPAVCFSTTVQRTLVLQFM
jgi:hypothetical protein